MHEIPRRLMHHVTAEQADDRVSGLILHPK